MAEGLFDIQRVFRQDHPGVIGIQMVAGEESHPAEIDAHVAFADAFASRADRNRRQRLNTNVQLLKVVNLAHRAIDHQPFPFILDGQTRQSASINARRTEPPPSIRRI